MTIAEVMFIIAVALLTIIVVLLIMLLRKPLGPRNVEFLLNTNIKEVLEEVGNDIKHVADVSAILSLMDQIEEHHDVIGRLQEYPEVVRAAAWTHYINCLGNDLRHAQLVLSHLHQKPHTDWTIGGHEAKNEAIKSAQRHVDSIRAKLDAAIAASGQTISPRTT